uniref:Ubiquitin carboxyl-terminal hydrolase 47 n=1 Tax=Hemiscolopendra marginata TaxID=943146 RepID=A0A646QG70_9MYRI
MVPGDNTQMVPVEGTMCVADEPRILCIIRDMTTTETHTAKITLNLPASTTGIQLVQEVAQRFRYEPTSFELILQGSLTEDAIIVSNCRDETLTEIGLLSGGTRNNLIVGEKNGEPIRKIEASEDNIMSLDDLNLGASASPVGGGDSGGSYSVPPPPPSSSYSPLADYNYSYGVSVIKQETGYVGLVNQAMTCYLNSLLQTLYMTPEFRNALYRWEFDNKELEAKSIPYQLQKLFLQLQTSKRHAIETTELTRSFGWDSSEAWQQHDVQELCRVMFDALELKFGKTDQANLINQLYQGKLKDYVKCLECGNESAREDTYLDIPLPVRPFDQTQSYGSVEEALHAFVQPEVLEDTNQYLCERCDKKCDAHKGLKFINFPYLLTLQLKRFDFDYNTMHRIKLNDKVTFPEILNLNSFIKNDNDLQETNDDASTTDSGSALDDDIGAIPNNTSHTHSTNIDVQDDDEGIDLGCNNVPLHNMHEVSTNEKNLRHSMEKGPYIYELFSIMVHSGSANGGHYYAYIKSFKDGHWYCFNDQSVTKITYDDIRKTYGGGPTRGYYSGAYSSSTNAYMLMYRQTDKERNAEVMSVEEFPKHIKKLLESMQEQEELERQQRELERNMCKIKLFCQHPIQNRMVDYRLKIHKDSTLRETTETAYKILDLKDEVPLERCRLVKYDELHDSLECSFENSDDISIGELMGGMKSTYKFDLLMEIRPPDKPFQVYTPGGTTVKVYNVNLEKDEVDEPITVRACLLKTVGEFQQQILEVLEVPPNTHVRMVLVKYSNDLRPLNNPLRTLKAEGFYRSNKVFIEFGDVEDCQGPFDKSKLCAIIDRFEHTVSLSVFLPAVSKEILDRLGIPSYEETLSEGDSKGFWGSGGGDASSTGPVAPTIGLGAESEHPPSYEIDDEGIGDSECDNGPNQGNGSGGVHSDQSEDSSLTDSDRTIVGGGSPWQEQEVISRHLCIGSSNSNSPQESCDDDQNLSSPEEQKKEYRSYMEPSEDWEEATKIYGTPEERKCYFKAFFCGDTDNKMLRVLVDKRITLGAFKKELEPYVGVAVNYFKVFRFYGNNQEIECFRLNENLGSFSDDTKVIIRLGRVLRKGEYSVKIFQLQINEPEPAKFLMDWILSKGMTVLDAKKELLPELAAKCGLEIPLSRCRLRRKSWRTPGPILHDNKRFDDDIPMYVNWEAYVEVLPGPEPVVNPNQLALFVRQWRPSTFLMEPFQEIVLDRSSVDELKKKISEISGIPPESIDFAKAQGTFPCEVSLLTIQKDLDWNPQVVNLNLSPLYICDDGHIIYYKDSREELKQLTEEERREIANKEHAKLHKNGRGGFSPRKEKALKIYTDIPPSPPIMTSTTISPSTATSVTTTTTTVTPSQGLNW